jgi:hypothetical protein
VAVGGQEVGEEPDGIGVRLDRALALVPGSQGAAEAGVGGAEVDPAGGALMKAKLLGCH